MVLISDLLSSTELLHSINLEAVIQLKLGLSDYTTDKTQLSASFIMQIYSPELIILSL